MAVSANPNEQLRQAWHSFGEEFRRRLEHLHSVWESAWSELRPLIEQGKSAPETLPAGARLADLEQLFESAGQSLLSPVKAALRLKPAGRVLQSLEDFDAASSDMFRQLPSQVVISGRELLEVIGPGLVGPWRRRLARWERRPRAVAVRRITVEHWIREKLRRARLEGAFQLILAQAGAWMLEAWEETRLEWLRQLSGAAPTGERFYQRGRIWQRKLEELDARARHVLERHKAWCESAPARLARTLIRRPAARPDEWNRRQAARYQNYFAYWCRQQRAIASQAELELGLAAWAMKALHAGERALQSLDQEHRDLTGEMESVIAWLESHRGGRPSANFPTPVARLVSAEERVDAWVREASSHARALLPTAVEVVEPRRALPPWRAPWAQLQPGETAIRFCSGVGRMIALEGFREAEAGHRSIIRDIERSREVVAFGLETARSDAAAGEEIARQGIENALELLRYQQNSAVEMRGAAEASLVRGLAEALLETYIRLDQGRLGLLAHFLRQAGSRGARKVAGLLLEGGRVLANRCWRAMGGAVEWVLCRAGLRTLPSLPPAPVAQTPRLGPILELQFGPHELPAIYKRLFRLAPVEDPRFLVGRDAELAGLAQARRSWEDGAYAAVVVVGARGSGKTSLLNCAQATAFEGAVVVRGALQKRLTTPEAIDSQLCEILSLPGGSDLHRELSQNRRIVIIEELERSFLRRVGGFDALRHLLQRILLTHAGTLWVVSLNEAAFRYLDAAVEMRRYFTHRVNAMSVRGADLRGAILLRHNLSGYRLEFAPPPTGNARLSRLRKTFGLEPEPQEMFFESLYRQSEGIFRSAFELWQRYIERLEGGVLHLRQPVEPNYSALTASLQPDDFFTLQAILQHGALTSREHAEVFLTPEVVSRTRLERLQGLELLEPDPNGEGLRVRPEAGRLVRDALLRRNLF